MKTKNDNDYLLLTVFHGWFLASITGGFDGENNSCSKLNALRHLSSDFDKPC